jgi:CBS domain-containing protein
LAKKARQRQLKLNREIRKSEKAVKRLKKVMRERRATLRKLEREIRLKAPIRAAKRMAQLKKTVLKKLHRLKVKPIRVSHVMTRDVKFVTEDKTLRDVLDLFVRHRISGVPVVSRGKVTGIICESDILRMAGASHALSVKDTRALSATPVKEAMQRGVICVRENDPLEVAIAFLNKAKVNRLPVVNRRGRLVGIVARDDIIKGMMELLFFRAERLPAILETGLDKMLGLIAQGPIPIDRLAQQMAMSEAMIEEWARILERRGLIEISYPALGKPVLRMRE